MVVKTEQQPNNTVIIETEGAQCIINLFGATVTNWSVNNNEVLFLSKKAHLDGSKAVRGGIPLVFPQFGTVEPPNPAHKLPQHGFARLVNWKYTPTNNENSASFEIDNETVKTQRPDLFELWSYKFKLIYTVTLTAKTLQTDLQIKNLDSEAILVTPLLHTYFNIGDITKAKVKGLQYLEFVDKVDLHDEPPKESRSEVDFPKEVDRVYIGGGQCDLEVIASDLAFKSVTIKSNHLDDAVVWNPWTEKSNALKDMHSDGYKEFCCVELGQVNAPHELQHNEDITIGQVLTVNF